MVGAMSAATSSKSVRLQELIRRRDKVLAVLHPPSAAHARVMEKAGCEALFVGTGGVVGAYTGLADVGTATMGECVTIAGWIADSVSIPVIVDGDTGHGGVMAVRRLVREAIRAGLAGIRIDDQPIEGKRKTQSAGVEVVSARCWTCCGRRTSGQNHTDGTQLGWMGRVASPIGCISYRRRSEGTGRCDPTASRRGIRKAVQRR